MVCVQKSQNLCDAYAINNNSALSEDWRVDWVEHSDKESTHLGRHLKPAHSDPYIRLAITTFLCMGRPIVWVHLLLDQFCAHGTGRAGCMVLASPVSHRVACRLLEWSWVDGVSGFRCAWGAVGVGRGDCVLSVGRHGNETVLQRVGRVKVSSLLMLMDAQNPEQGSSLKRSWLRGWWVVTGAVRSCHL